jgi:hypothetical protein
MGEMLIEYSLIRITKQKIMKNPAMEIRIRTIKNKFGKRT